MFEQTLRNSIAKAILLSSASLPLASASEPIAGGNVSEKPAASAEDTRENTTLQTAPGKAWEAHMGLHGEIRASQSVLKSIYDKIATTSEDAIYLKKALSAIEKALAADDASAVLPLQQTMRKNLELFAESEDGKMFRVEPILIDISESMNAVLTSGKRVGSNVGDDQDQGNDNSEVTSPEEIPTPLADSESEFVAPNRGSERPDFQRGREPADDDYSQRYRHRFDNGEGEPFYPEPDVQQEIDAWMAEVNRVRGQSPEFRNELSGKSEEYQENFRELSIDKQKAIEQLFKTRRLFIRKLDPNERNSLKPMHHAAFEDLVWNWELTPKRLEMEMRKIINQSRR